ncbi:MAG: hypothetical protein V3V99_08140 [candidate division Zixibacteria bacterium]
MRQQKTGLRLKKDKTNPILRNPKQNNKLQGISINKNVDNSGFPTRFTSDRDSLSGMTGNSLFLAVAWLNGYSADGYYFL